MRSEAEIRKALDLFEWWVTPENQKRAGIDGGDADQYRLGLQIMHDTLAWVIGEECESNTLMEENIRNSRQCLIFAGVLPAPGDTLFTESPDEGHPRCLCSRCGERIEAPPEEESAGDENDRTAALRVFVNGGRDGEYRYHPRCAGVFEED